MKRPKLDWDECRRPIFERSALYQKMKGGQL
jgi:hypothetical protein